MNYGETHGAGTLTIAVIFLAIYFLPTMVAIGRKHHNSAAIAILDLLLGWTFIGWVIALVWAFTAIPGNK